MNRDDDFKCKTLQGLAKATNGVFRNLKRKWEITEKETKYFISGNMYICYPKFIAGYAACWRDLLFPTVAHHK